MPKLKNLYMAKNHEELIDSARKNIPDMTKTMKPEQIAKSTKKLYDTAITEEKLGDQEKAYVHVIKALSLVETAQKKTSTEILKKYLNKDIVNNIITKAEGLKVDLCKRYEKRNAVQTAKKEKKTPEIKDVKKPPITNEEEKNGFINCSMLYSLIKQKCTQYLIIDTRPREEFSKSSIKVHNLINIPENVLKSGFTASKADKELNEYGLPLWKRREKFDYLIICDLQTESKPFPSPIECLIQGMTKWDPYSKYAGEILVLNGGFQLFSIKYPILVKNPIVEPIQTVLPVENDFKLDFDYPDLDKSPSKPEKKTNAAVEPNPLLNQTSNGTDIPIINRQLKPLVNSETELAENFNSMDISSMNNNEESNERRNTAQKPDPDKPTLPSIPSRDLKPKELYASNKSSLDKEKKLLQMTVDSEKKTLRKMQELENTQKERGRSSDSDASSIETKLKEDIDKANIESTHLEKDLELLRQENKDLRQQLRLIVGQDLKNIPNRQPTSQDSSQKDNQQIIEDDNAMTEMYKQLEIKRKERKENEMRMKQELEKNITKPKPKLIISDPSKLKEVKDSSPKTLGDSYTSKLKSSPTSPPARSTNLRRSHSSVNISQLTDDDGDSLKSPVMPTFDRAMKPLNRRAIYAAKQRNFEPKIGKVIPGRTGLRNLGNTCYMNSIIQCLSNTQKLANYFNQYHEKHDYNEKSEQGGEVAVEFAAVIRALWAGTNKCIAMWDLKAIVGKYHKPFDYTDQQDSHEFLLMLIDWLQDDLNMVSIVLPPMKEQNFNESITDQEAADTVLQEVNNRNNSIIDKLFCGLHRSVITCKSCNYRSLTFEPFSVLTVSFPTSGRCTLKDLLNDYYKKSHIEYTCEKCKKRRDCVRKMDIWKLPPVLVLHLNRFEQDVLMKKNQNYVDFPLEGLNLCDYKSEECRKKSGLSYDLYAISNHYGTMDGGHYTAYCRSKHSGVSTWLKFDDNEVYVMSLENVKTSASYILFYQKND